MFRVGHAVPKEQRTGTPGDPSWNVAPMAESTATRHAVEQAGLALTDADVAAVAAIVETVRFALNERRDTVDPEREPPLELRIASRRRDKR